MKKLILALSLISSILLAGCSSRYTYHEKPTPIKKGVTKYYLKNPVVNLTLGHGAIEGDKSFANQEALAAQFKKSLTQYLNEKNLLAQNEASAGAVLEITINFNRVFNYGGKALNKPQFSYQVNIRKNEKLLVSYSVPTQSPTRGRILDIAYNAKISAFQRGAEDELKDVILISETISDEIAEIGE
jgi:hypothetical protein